MTGRKQRQAEKAALQVPATTASTESFGGTGASLVRMPTATDWATPDGGTSDQIRDEESAASGTVGSGWAVLEKFVLKDLKRRDVFLLLWIALIIGLVWQDNSKGTITDLAGLLWTLKKCGIISAFLLALATVAKVGGWILDRITSWLD